jgi:hypothetical protein
MFYWVNGNDITVTPPEAKIISDKHVRACVTTVFTSNEWSYSRKRKKIVGAVWDLPAK